MSTAFQKKQPNVNTSNIVLEESRMRKNSRVLLCGCFYYSGLIGLMHWWKRRAEPHLVILNYHEAAVGDLRQHLLYLKKHYHIKHLEAALLDFYGLPQKAEEKQETRIPLVMTFDDGYYDNYVHCFSLAKELHIPMTIFIIPWYIEKQHRFWWNEARSLDRFIKQSEVTFEEQTYHLDQPAERAAFLRLIDMRARYAPTVAEREQFLETIHLTLGVAAAYPEEQMDLPMTWEQIREMEASGWISFGAHTIHHPFIGYLANADEVESEVVDSREVLQHELGHPVTIFAYPGGKAEHIGDYGLHAVHRAGFDWVVTTIGRVNTRDTDPLALRRIEVNLSDHWLVMAAKTVGLLDFLFRLRSLPGALIKASIKKA